MVRFNSIGSVRAYFKQLGVLTVNNLYVFETVKFVNSLQLSRTKTNNLTTLEIKIELD